MGLELLSNALGAIADEMAAAHVRAAYSSVVKDVLDFSTAVADGSGRVLAQGLSLALQLGAIPGFLRHLMRQMPDPRDGDVYLLNDPWSGGVHLPDLFFARPVFLEGDIEPIAYVVIVTHVVDIGGRFPGSISPMAQTIWEEGLMIPLVPIVKSGVLDSSLLSLIAANSREPVKVLGDIRAALAGLEIGARQVLDVSERFGRERLPILMDELIEYSERVTRSALMKLPNGTGVAVDYLDDDGRGGKPVAFRCRVTKRDDRLKFDFTGTDPQVDSSINCTAADVMSVVAFATAVALLEPIRVNEGFYRCLEFEIPDGTVASAQRGAAVGSRAASIYRLTDVALSALSGISPQKIPATDGGSAWLVFSGALADGTTFICLDLALSGWGASSDSDGAAGLSPPILNAANVPVEVIEEEYPIRVLRYEMVPDTAGMGEYLGSPSLVREYEAMCDGLTLNVRFERCVFPPQGLVGGKGGALGKCQVLRRGQDGWQTVPAKGSIVLDAGDMVRVQLAGGGGYGNFVSRDSSQRANDLRMGLISKDVS